MVNVGKVSTIPRFESAGKEQAAKVLEEAAEVFGAWQVFDGCSEQGGCEGCVLGCYFPYICDAKAELANECADLITATCNLLAGIGIKDMRTYLADCEQRNRDRGRYE